MTQIKKKKKRKAKACQFWKKKTFFISVLTIARETPKTKVKNPDKMYQLIFLKIYPKQQKQ